MNIRRVGITTGIRVFGATFAFLVSVIVTRTSDVGGSAIFFYGQAMSMLLAVLSRFGTDRAFAKLAAHVQATSARRFSTVTLRNALMVPTVLALAITMLFVMSHEILGNGRFWIVYYSWTCLRWFVFSVPCIASYMLNGWALFGLGRPAIGTLVMSVLPAGITVLLQLVLTYEQIFDRCQALAISYFVGTLVSAMAGWIALEIALSKIPKFTATHYEDAKNLKDWIRSLPGFALIGLANTVEQWYLTFILGVFSTPDTVSKFTVCNRFVIAVQILLSSINNVYSPDYANANSNARLVQVTKAASAISVVFGLPVISGILFFSTELLSFFDDYYRSASGVLMILMTAQFANVLSGPSATALVMRDGSAAVARIFAVATFWLVSLGAIMAHYNSTILIAIVAGGSVLIQSIGAIIQFRWEYGFVAIPSWRLFFSHLPNTSKL